nr:tRNA (adenosine(37)-N6)-threonylcarbamoyltransferase complex ATPase subunit type 1 TsaE [Candidatus Gracilibacteria bacterium]
MVKKYFIDDIKKIDITIEIPSIIFLYGDLGAGKTTIAKHIVNDLLGFKGDITSPTYTYYNKYKIRNNNIYHFDLYRLKNYDEFFAIGGEEILDNNDGIIIIEWPEVIEKYYKPDISIKLKKTKNEDEREITIE